MGGWRPAVPFVVGLGVPDLLHALKAVLSEETLIISAAQQAWPAGLLITIVALFLRGSTS